MNEVKPVEVAIIGSGGIGGFLAGALVGAGRDVALCVRTSFPELTIESKGETRTIPVRIATDPASVGPARWVLVTTKSQDTAGAEPWLKSLVGPETVVVVVQNGIGHVERAAPIANGAEILPAIIYCSVERTRPGHIVHHGGARMVVPAGEVAKGFVTLFAGTEFEIVESDDFLTFAWRKLLSNLVGNAITGITIRRTDVLGRPPIRALAARILDEAIAVAQAEGAGLTAADAEKVLDGQGALGPGAGTSMLYDRLAGRELEHHYITGALVAAADRHGIDAPANRTLYALLDAISGQDLGTLR